MASDIWLAPRFGFAVVAARQRARLASLVSFARGRSRLFRDLYAGQAAEPALIALPPVRKPQLMARFDEWVTDPAVTLRGTEQFTSDPARIGEDYLGRYAVWRGSGTSGSPGIFLHDATALGTYDLLFWCRAAPGLLAPADLWRVLAGGGRAACIAALDGHFAGVSAWRRLSRLSPALFGGLELLSVMTPVDQLVEQLNRLQPKMLVAYPSVLTLLAHEQQAGRLRLAPVLMMTGGECLDHVERDTIETGFGCTLYEVYGCSEFEHLAFGCREGWLHLNADWAILEPVDADLQPVPVGTISRTALLTNLANRIQPLIRYDLGDRILVRPDPCPCGSPLPVLRVEGRDSQLLSFIAADGQSIQVMPMALVSLLEEIPGMRRFQAVQTGPSVLSIRLEAEGAAARDALWNVTRQVVARFMAEQGLANVRIERSAAPPQADPHSGKFRQVSTLLGRSARPSQA